MGNTITVTTTVEAPVEIAWLFWTSEEHIVNWNNASDDWHTPFAENNVEVGGEFNYRMEAKDGSFGFDLKGTYTEVVLNKSLAFHFEDNRKITVTFEGKDDETEIIETFEPENQNPEELQRAGWQAILDNFKRYIENSI
ncbi:MAG: SRPBCC family protein [Bacteroidia bacterium]|nr:SRPBCC family protein [Bacteroidia bacterium]